jgi:hypothetical protein
MALSEPGDDDGWRITCDGLDAAWLALLGRLNAGERDVVAQDTPSQSATQ